MDCDYCAEQLPLWHRREPDSEGLEGAQFMPCSRFRPTEMEIVNVLATLIDANWPREDVERVKAWLE